MPRASARLTTIHSSLATRSLRSQEAQRPRKKVRKVMKNKLVAAKSVYSIQLTEEWECQNVPASRPNLPSFVSRSNAKQLRTPASLVAASSSLVPYHQVQPFATYPSQPRYEVDDLVWAKVKSFPWWPAQIAMDHDGQVQRPDGTFFLLYFGDRACHTYTDPKHMRHFRSGIAAGFANAKGTNRPAFQRALTQAKAAIVHHISPNSPPEMKKLSMYTTEAERTMPTTTSGAINKEADDECS